MSNLYINDYMQYTAHIIITLSIILLPMIETEAYKKHKEMIRSLLPKEDKSILWKSIRDMNLRASKKADKKATKEKKKR